MRKSYLNEKIGKRNEGKLKNAKEVKTMEMRWRENSKRRNCERLKTKHDGKEIGC